MNNIGEKLTESELGCRIFDANETYKLLRYSGVVFFSWGADNFIVDSKEKTKYLRFNVNGMKHKGYVFITLNGGDMYDVYIVNFDQTIKDKTPEMGLFFDQLTEWIDEKIEKQETYSF